MLDPVNPVRVRICTDYAGEAIGTLLKIMRRDDVSRGASLPIERPLRRIATWGRRAASIPC